jgi:hypothetical protein
VIETSTAKLARMVATQKLVMAQKKMMLNKNPPSENGAVQKEN